MPSMFRRPDGRRSTWPGLLDSHRSRRAMQEQPTSASRAALPADVGQPALPGRRIPRTRAPLPGPELVSQTLKLRAPILACGGLAAPRSVRGARSRRVTRSTAAPRTSRRFSQSGGVRGPGSVFHHGVLYRRTPGPVRPWRPCFPRLSHGNTGDQRLNPILPQVLEILCPS